MHATLRVYLCVECIPQNKQKNMKNINNGKQKKVKYIRKSKNKLLFLPSMIDYMIRIFLNYYNTTNLIQSTFFLKNKVFT